MIAMMSSLPLFLIPSLLRIVNDVAKFFDHCAIHPDLIESVDNQKRFQEYSYCLVNFAALQLHDKVFLNSR